MPWPCKVVGKVISRVSGPSFVGPRSFLPVPSTLKLPATKRASFSCEGTLLGRFEAPDPSSSSSNSLENRVSYSFFYAFREHSGRSWTTREMHDASLVESKRRDVQSSFCGYRRSSTVPVPLLDVQDHRIFVSAKRR